MGLLRAKFPPVAEARLDGEAVRVDVRISARARNYRLSIPHKGAPVLTIPRYGRWSEAQDFLDRQTAWLLARMRRKPPAVAIADGAAMPLRGETHTIVATGKLRGTVLGGAGRTLHVPGAPEHMARRLTDWLKGEALRDLNARVAVHAAALGVRVISIRVREQASRWGSCSATGRLNFNWRLILAPPFVLDYVAAHEVAHLLEMNHSRRFWDTVRRTLPDMERGRAWLKAHGRDLMVFGASA
jgi:predicted metal-dependent hydrolase